MRIQKALAALSIAAVFGVAAGTSPVAHAGLVVESEPNDSLGTAQNIDSFFDVFFNINIEDQSLVNTSTVIPHAEIHGTGNSTSDFYSFTVAAPGSVGIFDIDCGHGSTTTCTKTGNNVDAYLRLWNAAGSLLAQDDDFFFIPRVDTGSVDHSGGNGGTLDSLIQYSFAAAGTYYIQVDSCCISPVPAGADYFLNVSIADHATPVPEPASLALLGIGLAGLGATRRRKQS